MGFYSFRDSLHCLRILAKGNTALFYVWTGNIDLQHIYRLISQTFYYINVIFCGLSTHIDYDLCIIFLQKRNISFAEQINPRVLQTNGIDHAAVGLSDPWCWISRPWHICHTFCNNSTKTA